MNWQQMSKEQKQKIALSVLIGLFVVAAIYRLGITPVFDRCRRNAQGIADLQSKMDRARLVLRNDAQVGQQSKELKVALEKDFSADLPPSDNALSWASQFIYAKTRELGLEVVSIVESDSGGWDANELAKRIFKPYAVRVELACSFEKARNLVRSLQQSNPYLAVQGISIAADTKNIERPAVMLVLEWPTWRDAKKGQHPFEGPVPPKEIGK